MRLSIIIVTWKSKDDVSHLITSFMKHLSSLEYEVIVVDNASQDGTVELLRARYPEVTVIANEDNKGYAQAMNQGYAASSGEYLVFMNPDMLLHEDSFVPLMRILEEDHSIGLIAPQLRYADGTIQPTIKRRPTLISQILILLKLHHVIRPKSLKQYLGVGIDYTQQQSVERLMGACVMASRNRFESFGPWDQDYPLWWEDEQLCEDALCSGFKILYAPITYITHYEGKSFAQVLSVPKQKRFNKGMRMYFLKNRGIVAYLILLLLHPVSIILAYLVGVLRMRPRSQSSIITHK